MVAFTNPDRQYRASVMRFANDAWAYAGSNGDAISLAFADSVQLLVGPSAGGPGVAGVPYLAFMDYGRNSAHVVKLPGAGGTGAWVAVGGDTSMTAGQLPRMAFSSNGTLYLAHLVHPTPNARLMTVERYNRTLDAWHELGASRPAPNGGVTAHDLAVDANGVPCVVFNGGLEVRQGNGQRSGG